MNKTSILQQFRDSVYQILPKRADAIIDFIAALTVAGDVASPVALSEEAPFRRGFSSIYDVLEIERMRRPAAGCCAGVDNPLNQFQ